MQIERVVPSLLPPPAQLVTKEPLPSVSNHCMQAVVFAFAEVPGRHGLNMASTLVHKPCLVSERHIGAHV